MRKVSFLALGTVIVGASQAAILSISSGDTLLGNRPSNLVVNGSFEADNGFYPNLSYWATGTVLTPSMALSGWNASGQAQSYATWGHNGIGRIRGSDWLPHGESGLYFGASIMLPPSVPPSFAGNGVVTFPVPPILNAKPGFGPVTLSQTLTGLSTTQTYLLDFWASGETAGTGPMAQDGFFGLDITGEATTYLAAPSGMSALGASQRYYIYFKPVASSVTLTWTNWGHYVGNIGLSTELCLDDVIVNPVPEPTTMAMIGIGMASVLLKRRSNRKR